jgi:YesN/AraC family two-component response regulator
MCYTGINVQSFNPQILYVFDAINRGATETQYHNHDFIELSIIIDGFVEYNIEKECMMINKGDILLFNPGVYHREFITEDSDLHELHIGITNFRLEGFKKNFILTKDNSPVIRLKKHAVEFFNCCNDIIEEQKNNALGYDLVLKALVMKLLVILLRETHFKESVKNTVKYSFESTDKQNLVKSIINFMNENYMNEISLDKIAKNMYLSPVYISKIFKEETGDSPINYLIKIRLEKAKALLEMERLPVKLAAKSVGYDDAYYFSKLFKKYYGISPSKVS